MCREGDGFCFLGSKGHCVHRLPSEWLNYQWRILTRQLAEAAAKGNRVKMPWKTNEGVPFHQDNAPTHNSVVSIAAVHDCGFELVDHSPFSPDFGI